MEVWIDRCCRALDAVMATLLAVMVVLVFGNVVLRYGFNSGIAVSEELSRWAFVWLTFLGAVVALRERAHLGSDMLVSRLPRAGKQACLVLGLLLMLGLTVVLGQGAFSQARINWDVQAPVSGWSVSIFYGAGLVFALLAGLLILRDLLHALTGRVSDAELVMVKESEEAAELEALQAELARAQAPGGGPLAGAAFPGERRP